MAKPKVPRPSAGMKVKKNGDVTFQSNVDLVKFTLGELIDAANRDVGKYLRKLIGNKLLELYENDYVKGSLTIPRTGELKKSYPMKAAEYWARKKEHDLIIGFKKYSWYGTHQELGDYDYPRKGILRSTVMDNISMIQEIQSKYLTELNKEAPRIPEDTGDD